MAIITTFTANTVAKASEVNANFENLNTQASAEHNDAGKHTVINPAAVKQTLVTDDDGATVTFDLDVADHHQVTIAGNRIFAVSNADIGQRFIVRVVQGVGGNHTVTWFSTVRWAGGSPPTLTTAASGVDTFEFLCIQSNIYEGYILGQNIA